MPVQRFAQVFGAVYLLVGLLGFVFTGFSNFAGTEGDSRDHLRGQPAPQHRPYRRRGRLAASSRTEAAARAVSTLIGAVYLVLGVPGCSSTSARP